MRTLFILAVVATSCLALVIPRSQGNVAECVMCKLAVRETAPMLGKETVEIEQKFDNDCKKELKIPVEHDECEKYINEHLDPIIHELESGTEPKDVCTKLHGC
ncbi:surfactant protein B [Teladorsagia circumcincta]|uniref:Surfactant protein B n=1 Tax=Teladorsagia circumcincta TaxID=45464 RepID=A0A2G9UV99_TELCI|nr:surfactant protein B [Teladorsagia circumcincta]PIO76101.1 surfactant protein B [Teladorsagia circumcincta]